jgi:hypothetical protein
MSVLRRSLPAAALLFCLGGAAIQAQIKLAGREIQFHGYFQQGFALSSGNHFLTMNTRDGSFAMTDGGINISTRLTSKLRVGAQAYARNIGELGNGKVMLDWAFADYRFAEYFGIRGGKVKTTLGLFNDTQDMEFLYPWALLPQSVYPTDLRANTIAHTGGDIYGDIGLKKAGRLSFVGWSGTLPNDPRGGYYIGSRDAGSPISEYGAWALGSDLRWATPVAGLTGGYSYFRGRSHSEGRVLSFAGRPVPVPGGIPFRLDMDPYDYHVFYGDFQRGNLRLSAEAQLLNVTQRATGIRLGGSGGGGPLSWYVMGSHRVHRKWELGSYFSEYVPDRTIGFQWTTGIRDTVATARYDITSFWHVTVEGHFIHGKGGTYSFRGFYPGSNPGGLKERTNLLLVRTGFSF